MYPMQIDNYTKKETLTVALFIKAKTGQPKNPHEKLNK